MNDGTVLIAGAIIIAALISTQRRQTTGAATLAGYTEGEYCICTRCGYTTVHNRGIPCQTMTCPSCNIPLSGVYCR